MHPLYIRLFSKDTSFASFWIQHVSKIHLYIELSEQFITIVVHGQTFQKKLIVWYCVGGDGVNHVVFWPKNNLSSQN
ncbi:hypothetical protein IGI04_008720 [Brassica rapa subsp. trilocularis]|uniref:Neprosin domain-containing protein n=1 Tax=Brassica rapa subsp. trilocularis TaxID=1813537 RepID=A0ABQ7NQF8_BRACM|nr:hypothetical protein IGI04_008720 [Brassica rapa subsp. trilocularis]